MTTFQKCATCAYAPDLCASCRHNRELIERLSVHNETLTDVYAVAARLRQFPVPFDDHLALIDAVDKCRSILEPPVDNYNDAPASPSAWQAYVDAYPREEFLAMFRQAHATLHRLWTDAVGKEGYDKSLWKLLDNALARFARDAAEKSGISRSEPLL